MLEHRIWSQLFARVDTMVATIDLALGGSLQPHFRGAVFAALVRDELRRCVADADTNVYPDLIADLCSAVRDCLKPGEYPPTAAARIFESAPPRVAFVLRLDGVPLAWARSSAALEPLAAEYSSFRGTQAEVIEVNPFDSHDRNGAASLRRFVLNCPSAETKADDE